MKSVLHAVLVVPALSTLKVSLPSGMRVALKRNFILRCADKA